MSADVKLRRSGFPRQVNHNGAAFDKVSWESFKRLSDAREAARSQEARLGRPAIVVDIVTRIDRYGVYVERDPDKEVGFTGRMVDSFFKTLAGG